MTEQRLIEILINNRLSSGYVGYETSETIKEAMKQAVNEVLDEVVANTDQFDHIHKDEILKLKVK